jgi:hypothetical protein
MLRPKLRDEFAKACAELKLKSKTDALLEHARECVHFFESPRTKPRPGLSHIGGDPDLPDSLDWPAALDDRGKPVGHADFLAQVDLSQLPAIHDLPLPRTGHLWLFSQNFNKNHDVLILFHASPGRLRPRKRPSPSRKPDRVWSQTDNLRYMPLRFERGINLPISAKHFRRQFADVEGPALYLGAHLGRHDDIAGQIGGHSFQMEHDLYRHLALRDLGREDHIWADAWQSLEDLDKQMKADFPPGAGTRLNKYRPQLKWILNHEPEVAAAASAWQLLFMFRPSMRTGLSFGDGMYLDVFLKKSALAAADFAHPVAEVPMLL